MIRSSIPAGQALSLLQNAQTSSRAHPESYSLGIGIPSRRSIGRSLNLITYLYLASVVNNNLSYNSTLHVFFAWTRTSPFLRYIQQICLRFPVQNFPVFVVNSPPMFFAPLLIVFTLTTYLPDHILTLESVFTSENRLVFIK